MARLYLLVFVVLSFLAFPTLAQENTAAMLATKSFNDLPGKEGVMLTVEMAPGASSPKHRHNAHTFVYVLEGTVIMQVEGGEKVTLGPGEIFYETPEDIHSASINASQTEPAKILVFFVKDEGAPITIPVP